MGKGQECEDFVVIKKLGAWNSVEIAVLEWNLIRIGCAWTNVNIFSHGPHAASQGIEKKHARQSTDGKVSPKPSTNARFQDGGSMHLAILASGEEVGLSSHEAMPATEFDHSRCDSIVDNLPITIFDVKIKT